MTLLEQWLLAAVIILWICGGMAVIYGVSIAEGKRQQAAVKFVLMLLWPVMWIVCMYLAEDPSPRRPRNENSRSDRRER